MKEQLEAAKPEPIIDEVVGKAGILGNPELGIHIGKSGSGKSGSGKSGSGILDLGNLGLGLWSRKSGAGKLEWEI